MSEPSNLQRRGVVAVIVRQQRLLVIRRSSHVVAPGAMCFPGGGIEPGETEAEALEREFQEELGTRVEPLQRIWQSTTPWEVEIAWWHADLPADATIRINPAEVAAVHWMSLAQLRDHDALLVSNRDFLDAIQAGQIMIDGLTR